MRADKRLISGCDGLQVKEDPSHESAEDEGREAAKYLYGPARGYSGTCKDDFTSQPLRDDLVKSARAKEL